MENQGHVGCSPCRSIMGKGDGGCTIQLGFYSMMTSWFRSRLNALVKQAPVDWRTIRNTGKRPTIGDQEVIILISSSLTEGHSQDEQFPTSSSSKWAYEYIYRLSISFCSLYISDNVCVTLISQGLNRSGFQSRNNEWVSFQGQGKKVRTFSYPGLLMVQLMISNDSQ